jgi:two-component system, OmpR family, alkaline phosphatase synthesis response regulator PhoP
MSGQSILIVEDDAGSAHAFQAMLAVRGHRVRVVGDAEAALQEAEREAPEIALVDLHLPLADGVDFVRRVRSRARLGSMAMALVTGDYFIDDAVTDDLQRLGVPLYFKPLWEEDVVRIVETLVLRRRENSRVTA